MESRITLTDTVQSAILKMIDGNPGAMTACFALIENTPKIDPACLLGGLTYILSLDTYRIYGSPIYILWNDKCDRDPRRFILLLRATQLGLFSCEKLKKMSNDQMRRINISEEEWKEIDEQVCNQIETFKKE